MAARKRAGTAVDAETIGRRIKPVVERAVGARASRGGFEAVHRDELVNDTLRRAVVMLQRQPDANPEAVVRWHLSRAVTDLWRRAAQRGARLEAALMNVDPRPVHKQARPRGGGAVSSRDQALQDRMGQVAADLLLDDEERRLAGHTSFRFFEKEKLEIGHALMRITVALLPRTEDRDMFHARFIADGPEPTLQELADVHGVSVATVHNRLTAALELWEFVGLHLRMLDVRILEDLAGRLETDFSTKIKLEDLTKAAANYGRMQAELSTAHAEVGRNIATHMDWISANLPSRRAGLATALRRLADAAARYVLDTDDARHDIYSERGLHDDLQVARQVRIAIRDGMKGSR